MTARSRRTCKLLIALAVASLPGVAGAGLNIDVRATKINGVPISGANTTKSVTVHHVGDVVAFDVFAVVTGTNAVTNDDKFIGVSGSFKSMGFTKGSLLAELYVPIDDGGGAVFIPGFNGFGSSIGTQADLDSDGDLDVGSNTDSNHANFWTARFALAPAGIGAGSFVPTTGGRRIGFGTFTVTSLGDQSPTAINFFGRNAVSFLVSNYIQDGQTREQRSFDGLAPLQIFTPEPAVLSFALLGSLLRPTRRASRRRSASSRSSTSCRS